MLSYFLFFWSVAFSIEFYYSYLDYFIHTILTLVPILIVVAFFTLAERKAIASIQRRSGPAISGIFGFLQPFADALKLIVKEIIIPTKSSKFLFLFSPFLTIFLSLISWVVIPFDGYTRNFDLNFSLLFILVVSSLGVYGILFAGWSSNSKYALMGCLRSVSQMISYEVSISLIIIPIILFSNSLNINLIIDSQKNTIWYIFPLLPLSLIFLISILAETNRAPFDLPEAEAELVAGYNVEYSAILFVVFFLAEYANILLMSSLFVIFFLGGYDFSYLGNCYDTSIAYAIVFSVKTIILTFLFIFVRANLPRFRFDQLMIIGWKILLPIVLGFLFLFCGLLFSFNSLNISQYPEISFNSMYIKSFSTRF
jgi:NADH-quinone oxidoreductase subunit H